MLCIDSQVSITDVTPAEQVFEDQFGNFRERNVFDKVVI